MKHENKALRTKWTGRITAYENSGETMKEFCGRHGLSPYQMKYWRGQLRGTPAKSAAPTTTTWLELDPGSIVSIPTSTDSLVVHIGEATVELRRGFDSELLREIVRALASA